MFRTAQQYQTFWVQSKLVSMQVNDAEQRYIDALSSMLFLPSNSINLIRINAVVLIRLHRCTGSLEPSFFTSASRRLTSCPIESATR